MLAEVSGVDLSAQGGHRRRPAHSLRLSGPRDRRAARLFRPRRLGGVCAGPQDHRRRHLSAPPHPARLRARRERSRRRTSGARLLTFVVIGGGPTGVEMAGAIAELAKRALAADFRSIDPRCARIILVEAAPRAAARRSTRRCRRRRAARSSSSASRCGSATAVTRLQLRGRRARRRAHRGAHHHLGRRRDGVAGRPLARRGDRPRRPRQGRADLSVPGHPDVFVIGDTAAVTGARRQRCCPASRRSPSSRASMWRAPLIARAPRAARSRPFRYRDSARSPPSAASARWPQFGRLHLSGFSAWLLWSVAHVYFLIGFRNRFVVALNWAWSYITFQRGSRLITGLYATGPDGMHSSRLANGELRSIGMLSGRRGTSTWKCIRSDIFWRSPGR